MHARDFAEHHEIGLAGQLHDLGQLAFQRGRGIRDAGAGDRLAFGLLDPGLCRIRPPRAGRCPDETFITSRIAYSTMLTQNTPVSRILPTLSLVPSRSGLVAGRGEHHLRRHIGDRVEKAVGRQVVAPVRVTARDPADGARRDDGVERVVRQAVAVFGAVKHVAIPWRRCPLT